MTDLNEKRGAVALPAAQVIWDTAVTWEPLQSEALSTLLYDRDDTLRYIVRLEMAVSLLRSTRDYDKRFFDAVNTLGPDVCERALDAMTPLPTPVEGEDA